MITMLKVNSRGTMTLPKPLREALGVGSGGTIAYTFRDGAAVLQSSVSNNWPPVEMYTDERIAEFDAADAALGEEVDRRFEKRGWIYDPKTRQIRDKFGNLITPMKRNYPLEPFISEPLMVCEEKANPYRAKGKKEKA